MPAASFCLQASHENWPSLTAPLAEDGQQVSKQSNQRGFKTQASTQLQSWNAHMVLSQYVIQTLQKLAHDISIPFKSSWLQTVLSSIMTVAVSSCKQKFWYNPLQKNTPHFAPTNISPNNPGNQTSSFHHQLQLVADWKKKIILKKS